MGPTKHGSTLEFSEGINFWKFHDLQSDYKFWDSLTSDSFNKLIEFEDMLDLPTAGCWHVQGHDMKHV